MTEAERLWLKFRAQQPPMAPGDYFIAGFEAGRESVDSWDGLMAQLDRHYPADLMAKWPDDPGPRIVALIRQIDQRRKEDSR